MIFLNDALINSSGSLKGTFTPTAHIFFSVVLFIYLFIFGCTGSSLLCGLFSSHSAWLSHCVGFSCCGARTLG